MNIFSSVSKMSLSEIEKAFSESVSVPWEEHFSKQNGGVKPVKSTSGIAEILGDQYKDISLYPPGIDHYTLWARDGEPPDLFTMQPYELDIETCRQLIDFCDQYGLEFSVEGRSWYNPGVTTLFVFRRRRDR